MALMSLLLGFKTASAHRHSPSVVGITDAVSAEIDGSAVGVGVSETSVAEDDSPHALKALGAFCLAAVAERPKQMLPGVRAVRVRQCGRC